MATFLQLKRLLAGIQEELDASWAVLGEVYGRYPPLSELGLNLRRVRSNLDDEAAFAKTVNYLPCEAAFDAAGPELLKLLIKPLYGEHPEIGIRELLQNAVDACRELKDYLAQSPETLKPEFTEQGADVEIQLQDKGEAGRWLEVSDRGIGMSAETVRRYFLRAGASFRRSDAWRKIHETPEGRSRVLRSGRFGIGVLAAFLLGDEVEVSTRNAIAQAGTGIAFKATLDTEDIELRHCSRPVGTTIRVRTSEEGVWKSLAEGPTTWDWYCLPEPSVARSISARPGEGLLQKFTLPGPNAKLGSRWRRVKHENYADIQWSYWEGAFLACNGIVVMKSDPSQYSRSILGDVGDCEIVWPKVSVFDPDGHLPLVLQRNSLARDKYPFHEQLFRDTTRDLLAYLLVRGPRQSIDTSTDGYGDWYPGVSSLSQQNRPSFHLCSAEEGLYPSDEWHIKKGGFHRFLLAGGLAPYGKIEPQIPHGTAGRTLLIPVPRPGGAQRYREWNRFALCGAMYGGFGYLQTFAVACRRMLLRRSEYDIIRKGNVISKYWWSAVKEESSNSDWIVVRNGDCDCGNHFDLLEFAASIEDPTYWPLLIEWHLPTSQSEPKTLSPLTLLWRDLLPKTHLIPYDPPERRKDLPAAFDQLRDYVVAHEQLVADEKAKRETKKTQPSSDDDASASASPLL